MKVLSVSDSMFISNQISSLGTIKAKSSTIKENKHSTIRIVKCNLATEACKEIC